MDYARDWAAAAHFAIVQSQTGVAGSSTLVDYIVNGLKAVVSSSAEVGEGGISAAGAVQSSSGDEGFARLDKRIMMARALVYATIVSTFKPSTTTYPTAAAAAAATEEGETVPATSAAAESVIELVSAPGADIVSAYRSTRSELAVLLCCVNQARRGEPGTGAGAGVDLSTARGKVVAACVSTAGNGEASSATVAMDAAVAAAVDVTVQPDLAVSGSAVVVGSTSTAVNTLSKSGLEVACSWLQHLLRTSEGGRGLADIPELLTAVLTGCGHADVDTAKMSHDTCKLVVSAIRRGVMIDDSDKDLLSAVLAVMSGFVTDTSLHVRETVLLCITILMTDNWQQLSADERKTCKAVLDEGLVDAKPEVQTLAMSGMVAYLAALPAAKLRAAAASYIKNSDTLAARYVSLFVK